MKNALLIAAMILLYTAQSLLCKKYSDNYPGKAHMASPVFTIVSGFTVVIVSFLVSGFSFSAAPLTLLLGAVNAVTLFGYNHALIKASQLGPYSVVMTFSIAGGISVPAIVAYFAFGDTLSPIKIISILVVFISVYLISHKTEDSATNKKFFLSCLLLGVCNGAYGVFLDVQQRLTGSGEKEEMVALTYGVAVVISLISLFITDRKEVIPAMKQTKKSLFFLIACSLVVAGAINLLVYIIPHVNVTILYTLDNAGVLLLSVLFSCMFFKEKLSPLNIVGCVTMCAALVCVSLF